ncbi:uncharacterized protein tmem79a isoform X2 [Pangasianodon hypophthalmus]|uniref:uncharacterized protein tmem79a isoform X2 n=1 Tax=Pangasianodon hypophthalmus TaxID=310915 RepID=UPI002307AF7C|nr:uncharacterized protein tmem79a isoform X2 [Pangasianodon hypophthalmus]
MEEKLFPVSEPFGERGMNERQEVENREQEETVYDSEERTTGLESRTESERQLDVGQERWRDDGDGSLADDEDEDDDDDDDDGHRMSFVFTPLVKIVRKTAEIPKECHDIRADDVRADDVRADDVRADDVRADDVRADDVRANDVNTHMENTKQSPRARVLVHGVSRLKFSSLNPLFKGKHVNRHTLVHMTYVQDSLRLFLLFFVQLAVMSTYIHHEALKLVPLLTIVFVFGRLIYWPSVCFGSSVRVLGFSLSFLPVLALLGFNLYFICSSTGEGVVFDVAPPTTPPPPKARWWG